MRSLIKCKDAMVSFIMKMVIALLVISATVGTVAYNLYTASTNTGVTNIPGGATLVLILGLIFIVTPIIILSKRAR